MVRIWDVSLICINASYDDKYYFGGRTTVKYWLALLLNCQKTVEDEDLQIASLMYKLEAYKIIESSQRHEPYPNVQPQANSKGNPLRRSLITQKHEHSAHQGSIASLSIQKLQYMITNIV